MRKIMLLMIMLSGMVMAKDMYIGLAGSMSDADEYDTECRASGVLIAGVKIFENDKFKVDAEGRLHVGLGGDYNVQEVFIKPEYNSFYALIGAGTSNIGDETFTGVRGGVGYQLPKNIFIDVVYREPEDSFVTTLGFRYRF